VTEPTVLPSMTPLIEAPCMVRDRVCQLPVPSAPMVPLARVVMAPLVLLLSIDQAPVFEARNR
jgi:hypothetical protein